MGFDLIRVVVIQSLIIKIISSQQITQYVSVAPPSSIPPVLPTITVQRSIMPPPSYPSTSYSSKGPVYVSSYEPGSTCTPAEYSSAPDYTTTSYGSSASRYFTIPPRFESTLPSASSRPPIPIPEGYPKYTSPYSVTPDRIPPGLKPVEPPERIPVPPNGYKLVPPPGYFVRPGYSPIAGYKQGPALDYNTLSSVSPRKEYIIELPQSYTLSKPAPDLKPLPMPSSPKTALTATPQMYPITSSFPSTPKTSLPTVSLMASTISSDSSQTSPSPSSSSTSSTIPESETPGTSEYAKDKGVDSKLLNNLAVALQLLIVSNILNTPPPAQNNTPLHNIYESVTNMAIPLSLPTKNSPSSSDTSEGLSSFSQPKNDITLSKQSNNCPDLKQSKDVYYEPNVIDQIPLKSFQQICESSIQLPTSPFQQSYERLPSKPIRQLQNANYLSSSSFGGASFGTLPLGSFGIGPIGSNVNSNTRSNYALMSPYEALGSSSKYSDPILTSPYGNSFKNDFQSPYSAILADDSDLFTMADLF